MKKRCFAILLALLMLCALLSPLSLPTAAASVVLSSQKLLVDGTPVECEKYNIDGSNYFKLRDLAAMLNGTGSQFSVEWDAVNNRVCIETGQAYAPDGSELQSGKDNSALAKPSRQTIFINGTQHGDLHVYNIGGNNFFQLRELGALLNFEVGYAALSNTATVTSAPGAFSLPPQSVLLAEPISGSALSPLGADGALPRDSVLVQNPVSFFMDKFKYKDYDVERIRPTYVFSGSYKNVDLIEAYVSALISHCNMELVDKYNKYYSSFNHERYFSWGLRYVGTGSSVTETDLQYVKNKTCDVLIWGHGVYSTIENLYISIPPEMEFADLGLRCDGSGGAVPGASALSLTAGLYLLPDGSFTTSDGRLSTTPGHAMVLRDGTACTAAAAYENANDRTDCISVEPYYRTEGIYFGRARSEMMTGDIYTLEDLKTDDILYKSQGNTRDKSMASFHGSQKFGLGHDGLYITPHTYSGNLFDDLVVRVMYLEKDVLCVLYVYAELKTTPRVVEALIAVELGAEPTRTAGTNTGTDSRSFDAGGKTSGICPICGGLGYRLCQVCGGDGKIEVYVSGGGASGLGQSHYEIKDCQNLGCSGGRISCSRCFGTGKSG